MKQAISSNLDTRRMNYKQSKFLEDECSVSGEIFQRIGLTRCIIERTLAELTHSRKEQTALCNIICATRFKYAQDGKLYPTVCRRRGRQETFQHMVKCANLKVPVPTEDPDPTIAFLKELAKSACKQGTARPIPHLEPIGQHLDLDPLDDSDADLDALEFD